MPPLACMVFLVLIIAGPVPVGAEEPTATAEAFRAESLPSPDVATESTWSLMPGTEEGSSHPDRPLVTLRYPPELQVAQVTVAPPGTPSGSPAPEREEEGASLTEVNAGVRGGEHLRISKEIRMTGVRKFEAD